MWIAENWRDYEILDAADGEKLERWGDTIIIRPDPTVIWKGKLTPEAWGSAKSRYIRSKSGGGGWNGDDLAEFFVTYGQLKFKLKQFGFKHTGLFPEQAANWDWFAPIIQNAHRTVRVLNLFAYTGGATMAAAKAGASVCHVDASKGMTSWAKDNARLCGLEDAPIRYIVDDCIKFMKRELRRGSKYDAIIMDPPSYGRGPGGEVFKTQDALFELCDIGLQLLGDKPLFFLVNSYTTIISPSLLKNVVKLTVGKKAGAQIEADELGLVIGDGTLTLPCGVCARVVF